MHGGIHSRDMLGGLKFPSGVMNQPAGDATLQLQPEATDNTAS